MLVSTSTEQLQAAKSALLHLIQESDDCNSSFMSAYSNLMSLFESKRQVLEEEVARASCALTACEAYRGPNGEHRNCSSEESRYAKAQAKLNHFESLVGEANARIKDYESVAMEQRNQIMALQTTGDAFIDQLVEIVQLYDD